MEQFYKLSNLTGYRLNADDGEIGKLEEILFDDQCWIVRYFIVNTGSWLLLREVLIAPEMITGINEGAKTLDVSLTREQVKNCPLINTKLPVSRHYEQEYYKYYGRNPYWSETLVESLVHDIEPAGKEFKEPQDIHLRSSKAVSKYNIHASDGDIGQVEDFILEKEGWEISYLEINTGKWFPGKHVLITPNWIRNVDWEKQEVKVDLNRKIIETAPSYDPSKIISQEYQVELFEHYGMSYEEEKYDK